MSSGYPRLILATFALFGCAQSNTQRPDSAMRKHDAPTDAYPSDRWQVNPAERHFDAYMTWTNYTDESHVDATEFIVNGKQLGSGRDGYLAAVAELRRLPVGAAVVIFPAYHWAIFSN